MFWLKNVQISTQYNTILQPKAGTYDEPFRLPMDHDIFKRLSTILVSGAKAAENDQWVPLGAQGVNVIYRLAEKPDLICGDMMKQLAEEIMTSQSPDHGDGKQFYSIKFKNYTKVTIEIQFHLVSLVLKIGVKKSMNFFHQC